MNEEKQGPPPGKAEVEGPLPDFDEGLRRGLLGRVVRGGAWAGLGNLLGAALPAVRNLILMKGFLSPAEWSLWGAMWVVVSGINIFTTTNVATGLIQKPEGSRKEYLQAAWMMQAVRGVILGLITFAGAELVAWYYGRPDLVWPFRCLAMIFVVTGVASPRVMLLVKEMEFKKVVALEQASTVCSVAVGIGLGIWLRSVWALVIGEMVRVVVLVGMGYVMAPFRPGLSFARDAAKDLWKFGRQVYASNTCLFLLLQGDYLVVGRMLAGEQGRLGNYWQGRRFTQMPAEAAAGLVSRVSFPAYAKMGDERDRIAGAYLRVLRMVACYAWPVALGMACLAPVLPKYAGAEWASMVLTMQILCVATLAQCLNSAGGALFLGMGKPELLTRVTVINLIVLAALLVPMAWVWSIEGAAAAISLSQAITCVAVFYYVRRELKTGAGEIARAVVTPAIAGLAMTAVVIGLGLAMARMWWAWYALTAVGVGAGVYGGTLLLTAAEHVEVMKKALREGTRN